MRAEWRKKEGLLDAHIGANEADKILVAICPATAAASLDPYRFHFYENGWWWTCLSIRILIPRLSHQMTYLSPCIRNTMTACTPISSLATIENTLDRDTSVYVAEIVELASHV